MSPPSEGTWTVSQNVPSGLTVSMACRLVETKLLPAPMLTFCQLEPWQQISQWLYCEEIFLNMSSVKWHPFYPRLNVLTMLTLFFFVPFQASSAKSIDDSPLATNNNESSNNRKGGCNPISANATCYVIATILFVVAFNVPKMASLPFPLIGNLLPQSLWNFYERIVVVALVMWGLHFIRRFTEVLFVHRYSRRQSVVEAVGASVYYGFFGLWVGWSMNYYLGYKLPHPGFFYPGVLLFIIGEIGNCAHHVKLMLLGKQAQEDRERGNSSARHKMPEGLLFNYVSCPHYFFEIVTWIGYSLATMVLPVFVFLAATVITLSFYSYRNHQKYQADFPDYPTNRKMLIPFIL